MPKSKAARRLGPIALKRKIHAQMNRETKGMTLAEKFRWMREEAETGPMGEWWKSLPVVKIPPTSAEASVFGSVPRAGRRRDVDRQARRNRAGRPRAISARR